MKKKFAAFLLCFNFLSTTIAQAAPSGPAYLDPTTGQIKPAQTPATAIAFPQNTKTLTVSVTNTVAASDIATVTPSPSAIPLAGTDNKIAVGWLPSSIITNSNTSTATSLLSSSGQGQYLSKFTGTYGLPSYTLQSSLLFEAGDSVNLHSTVSNEFAQVLFSTGVGTMPTLRLTHSYSNVLGQYTPTIKGVYHGAFIFEGVCTNNLPCQSAYVKVDQTGNASAAFPASRMRFGVANGSDLNNAQLILNADNSVQMIGLLNANGGIKSDANFVQCNNGLTCNGAATASLIQTATLTLSIATGTNSSTIARGDDGASAHTISVAGGLAIKTDTTTNTYASASLASNPTITYTNTSTATATATVTNTISVSPGLALTQGTDTTTVAIAQIDSNPKVNLAATVSCQGCNLSGTGTSITTTISLQENPRIIVTPASVGAVPSTSLSGTVNYHAKFTGTGTDTSNTLASSIMHDDGTSVMIGTSTQTDVGKLHVIDEAYAGIVADSTHVNGGMFSVSAQGARLFSLAPRRISLGDGSNALTLNSAYGFDFMNGTSRLIAISAIGQMGIGTTYYNGLFCVQNVANEKFCIRPGTDVFGAGTVTLDALDNLGGATVPMGLRGSAVTLQATGHNLTMQNGGAAVFSGQVVAANTIQVGGGLTINSSTATTTNTSTTLLTTNPLVISFTATSTSTSVNTNTLFATAPVRLSPQTSTTTSTAVAIASNPIVSINTGTATNQVIMGNDPRLTNDRPSSNVLYGTNGIIFGTGVATSTTTNVNANPTISGANLVPTTRSVIAGNGLTGGGTLGSNVTLNVAAGDGSISVGADSIAVGVISDAQHGNRGGGSLHSLVTTITNGFMSTLDKIKVDGIATGATNTPLSNAIPLSPGFTTENTGVSAYASRADHRHPDTISLTYSKSQYADIIISNSPAILWTQAVKWPNMPSALAVWFAVSIEDVGGNSQPCYLQLNTGSQSTTNLGATAMFPQQTWSVGALGSAMGSVSWTFTKPIGTNADYTLVQLYGYCLYGSVRLSSLHVQITGTDN